MSHVNSHRITSAIAVFFLLCACSARAARAQSSYDIPAQPLAQALKALALQAGINIYFDPPAVTDLMAPELHGVLLPEAAVARLLAGTRLRVLQVDHNTFRVVTATQFDTVTRTHGVDQAKPSRPVSASHDDPSTTQTHSDDPVSPLLGSQITGQQIAPSSQSRPLQEVVVTAEKVKEREIDVPMSMTVLSSKVLSQLGATDLTGYASTVPGLSYQTSGTGYSQITLRGVTTGFDVSPTVGIYLDDVPIGSSTAFAQGAQLPVDVGLFDVSRIDVLRGPQGTLYGASTLGGLVKYVTAPPNLVQLEGDVRSGVSQTQGGGTNYYAAFSVNDPLSAGTASVRASVYYSRNGGFVNNLALHDNHADQSGTLGARLDFLLQATDALTIRITGFLQNILRDGEATVDYLPSGQPEYGDLDQFRGIAEPYDQHFRLISATVTYDLSWADLTSISSFQSMQEVNLWDISAVYVPLLSNALGINYESVGLSNSSGTNKFTEETRLASKQGGPLSWLVGGFYTHESNWYAENFVLNNPDGTQAVNNLYQFWSPSAYEEYAFFGNVTWTIAKVLALTGGVRYAHNRQDYTQFGSGLLIGSLPTSRSQEGVTTYLADARYRINNRANAYFRYATGYRPGGPNLAARNPSTGAVLGTPTFGADRLQSYEVGVKAESADRLLGMDLDVYDIEWNNIQIFAIKDGFGFRANAPGGARIQGSELTLTAAATNRLQLTASAAYQHAYMRQADVNLGASEGERLPNVPRVSAAGDVQFILSRKYFEPTVGATITYESERRASFDESLSYPQYTLPAYARVDLRAGLTLASTHLQFYIHNLANRRGQLADMLPQFGTRVAILQPRIFGIDVVSRF